MADVAAVNMKTVCIIQARMGSTRLPGKVMTDLGGRPVLEWAWRACSDVPGIDEVMIATSTLPGDDVIEQFCDGHGIRCFRGSETDVLSRFVGAAEASGADIILRQTADCPFLDPQVIGAVVRLRKQSGAAYCSNIEPRTYADGLDTECFTREALMAAHAEAARDLDRDCVTTWIARNRSRFPAEAIINPIPGQYTERYVLDTADDMKFCQEIVKRWSWECGPPSQLDILAILDEAPAIRDINRAGVMNERYFAALADEPIYPRSYARSQEAFRRAEKVIPLAAQTFSKSHLQFPQPSPLFVTHGQGGEAFDIDGNSYIDLVSALLPVILGYRDPEVDAAVRRQLNAGVSFSLATELEAQLAETLGRLIPCAEMVRFGKNGTDVTTAALRLARAYTGRDRVLICGGYHGWGDWSLAGTERALGVPDDVARLTTRIPFGDATAARLAFGNQAITLPFEAMGETSYAGLLEIEKRLKKDWYAAVIVEPESDPDYLRDLRWLCTRYGALLIFDEVITGFRVHLGGAQALYGITPDLACFGKAMANGLPLSAIVGRADIMKRMAPPDNIFYSGTFAGETLSLAASIATIDKLERTHALDYIAQAGFQLREAVQNLINANGLETTITLSGHDALVRLSFKHQKIAALFRREMIAAGVLIIASHNLCYAHGPNERRRVCRAYDRALGVVADAVRKGDIDKRLGGAAVALAVRQ